MGWGGAPCCTTSHSRPARPLTPKWAGLLRLTPNKQSAALLPPPPQPPIARPPYNKQAPLSPPMGRPPHNKQAPLPLSPPDGQVDPEADVGVPRPPHVHLHVDLVGVLLHADPWFDPRRGRGAGFFLAAAAGEGPSGPAVCFLRGGPLLSFESLLVSRQCRRRRSSNARNPPPRQQQQTPSPAPPAMARCAAAAEWQPHRVATPKSGNPGPATPGAPLTLYPEGRVPKGELLEKDALDDAGGPLGGRAVVVVSGRAGARGEGWCRPPGGAVSLSGRALGARCGAAPVLPPNGRPTDPPQPPEPPNRPHTPATRPALHTPAKRKPPPPSLHTPPKHTQRNPLNPPPQTHLYDSMTGSTNSFTNLQMPRS